MATKIRGVTIEINAETTKFTAALKKLNSSLSGTQKELRDVDKLLKLDPTNTTLLKQKQDLLKKAIQDTKDKLKEEKGLLEQLKSADDGTNIKQQQALEREIADTEANLKSLTKEYQNFGSVASQQIKAVATKMSEVGQKITDVGKDMTTKVSVPIVAGLGAAVKVATDYEAEMDKVQAISGANAEQMEALSKAARDYGKSTKFTATEAGQALEYMAMAGWKPEDMLEGLGGVLNLAVASGGELGETSDIVTDALTALKLSAKDTTKFVDILAAASTNSNTNVSMMGESFKYAAPLMGTLFEETGTQAEDTAIALGLMANAGIKSSTAGTSLRRILTNMVKPTADVEDAMEELGIRLYDTDGHMNSFHDIMGQMRTGFGDLMYPSEEFNGRLAELDKQLEDGSITESEYTDSLTDLIQKTYGAEAAEKAQTASVIAGQTGLSGLLAIVNASPEDFDSLTQAIYDSDGAAQRMADTMGDNTQGDVARLKSAVEELGISLTENLIPYIRDLIQWVQGVVDWFNSLDQDTKDMIVTILLVVAAIGPLLAIIGTVIDVCGKLAGAISFLTSPIGLAVAAIGGAIAIGVLLYKNWDTIKEKAAQLGQNIKNIFDGIKQTIGNAVDRIKNLFNFSWSFPKIKLPHFSWSWQSIGGLVSIPSISVDWYAKAMKDGMILNSPTIFGAQNGKLLGGGEAGSETVVGTNSLMQMIRTAVGSASPTINVYGAEGQDVRQLADIVMQKMEHRVQVREGALT